MADWNMHKLVKSDKKVVEVKQVLIEGVWVACSVHPTPPQKKQVTVKCKG